MSPSWAHPTACPPVRELCGLVPSSTAAARGAHTRTGIRRRGGLESANSWCPLRGQDRGPERGILSSSVVKEDKAGVPDSFPGPLARPPGRWGLGPCRRSEGAPSPPGAVQGSAFGSAGTWVEPRPHQELTNHLDSPPLPQHPQPQGSLSQLPGQRMGKRGLLAGRGRVGSADHTLAPWGRRPSSGPASAPHLGSMRKKS